jgi:hypothetical protein
VFKRILSNNRYSQHYYCGALHHVFFKFSNNSFVVSQNWNFNQETGKASTNLNLWNRPTRDGNGKLSVDCVNCFAQFKASATVKYKAEYGTNWFVPYLKMAFMAEISIRAIANIDLQFMFEYAYENEYSKKLASITPMLNQAMSGFSILGFPLTLGITYGLDITIGVTFAAQAKLGVTLGADVQCNYRFGIYYNYPRPSQPNGCSRSYHRPKGTAEGSIDVIFYMNPSNRVYL